jgi:hypothetical protein
VKNILGMCETTKTFVFEKEGSNVRLNRVHSEELHNFNAFTDIISMMKRRMRCTEHVACMRPTRDSIVSCGKPGRKKSL